MEPNQTEISIQELERVRKQINLWRSGSAGVIVLTMAICVGLLWSDARALAAEGPTQQVFIDNLQAGLNENVVPRLQEVASHQLTGMQPIVQREFVNLNKRVPDLTQASLKQLDELQVSLPARGSKVLDETFDKAFRAKEPEIKTMFPDATEDQVKTFFTNLGTIVSARSEKVADELLRPQMTQMEQIHRNLLAIETSDKKDTAETNDWEMGLAVFDVIRTDLKGLTLPKGKPAKIVADTANKKSDGSGHIAVEADKTVKGGGKK